MAIHRWHTDKLVGELAEGGISEDQSLRYAMISAVLYFQETYYATWFGGYRSWLLLLEFIAVTVIAFIGLQECFKANGGSSGSHFLKRLFCLGVPVGLKVAIASALTGQLIYFGFSRVVTQENFRNPYFIYQLLSFFIAGAFTVFYYWRIAYHMARLAKLERSYNGVQATPASGRA
jgi:ethanolamine transporter EutH